LVGEERGVLRDSEFVKDWKHARKKMQVSGRWSMRFLWLSRDSGL
jgi:hypothetical protein